MIQTKGFLYGHYDSRGGTIFVIANSRVAADKAYVKAAGWPEDDLIEEAKVMIKEDFFGEAFVFLKQVLPEGDLEDGEEGTVICSGGKKSWPPDPDDIDGDEFMQNVDGEPILLEFVEKDAKPVAFKTGWHHPRWNDDAFGFYVVKA